jgi:hypothetical protein
MDAPAKITLDQWDARYAVLRAGGLAEPFYGGPLGRHLAGGDRRLAKLRYDNSPAALRLWNFLLTEDERLFAARAAGQKIVGVMKDLGTTAAMAMSLPEVTAFYPDGAWWIPCLMEHGAGVLEKADSLGIDESFCPVRAMLGAFATGEHFPRPDLLVCSAGAVCDDFSAVAQLVEGLGGPILWWEMPARRRPADGEPAVRLPTGFVAPASQVAFVRGELERVRAALEELAGRKLDDATLAAGIVHANRARRLLEELRILAYSAEPCPLPALEMLIAEMLIIHYCSDRAQRICADIRRFGSEAVVISRIPGASHCALEGGVIGGIIGQRLGLPVLEIEVPPLSDSMAPALRTRLEAIVEVVKERRR